MPSSASMLLPQRNKPAVLEAGFTLTHEVTYLRPWRRTPPGVAPGPVWQGNAVTRQSRAQIRKGVESNCRRWCSLGSTSSSRRCCAAGETDADPAAREQPIRPGVISPSMGRERRVKGNVSHAQRVNLKQGPEWVRKEFCMILGGNDGN